MMARPNGCQRKCRAAAKTPPARRYGVQRENRRPNYQYFRSFRENPNNAQSLRILTRRPAELIRAERGLTPDRSVRRHVERGERVERRGGSSLLRRSGLSPPNSRAPLGLPKQWSPCASYTLPDKLAAAPEKTAVTHHSRVDCAASLVMLTGSSTRTGAGSGADPPLTQMPKAGSARQG